MYDVFCRKVVSARQPRFAGRAAVELSAFFVKSGTRRAVYCAVDAAPRTESGVGGVYYRVAGDACYIVSDDLKRHELSLFVFFLFPDDQAGRAVPPPEQLSLA